MELLSPFMRICHAVAVPVSVQLNSTVLAVMLVAARFAGWLQDVFGTMNNPVACTLGSPPIWPSKDVAAVVGFTQ